jgi:hypothetical protein
MDIYNVAMRCNTCRYDIAATSKDPDITPGLCEICKNPLGLLKVSIQTRTHPIVTAVRQVLED